MFANNNYSHYANQLEANMTYLIDAWLDRPQPYLRILDRSTGAVCISLEGDALDELRDQGVSL